MPRVDGGQGGCGRNTEKQMLMSQYLVSSARVRAGRCRMTKGQRTMTIALLSPEPEGASERGKKGGRGKKATTSGGVSAAPQQRIADARAVLVPYFAIE